MCRDQVHGRSRGCSDPRDTWTSTQRGRRGSSGAGFRPDLSSMGAFIGPRPRPVANFFKGQFQLCSILALDLSDDLPKGQPSATLRSAGGGPNSWSGPAMSPRSWHFPPAKPHHRLPIWRIIGEVLRYIRHAHGATTIATLIAPLKTKAF